MHWRSRRGLDREARRRFVESAVGLFIRDHPGVFDGIDLDWEWPASEGNTGNVIRAEDKANFLALVREFRSQLDAYGATVGRTYELTAFLPADTAKIDAARSFASARCVSIAADALLVSACA